MANPNVVLFASSTAPNISAWDLQTGTFLTAYKGNASPRNGLCCLGREYLVACQAGKSAVHFWTWHKDQVLQRCFAVETITALAATSDGVCCAGGGTSGHLYVWEVASGRLLASWPAHYKRVTALAFSDGGAVLLSGAEDTVVHAWLLMDLLDASAPAAPNHAKPALYSWSDHTLPVTAIWTGAGGTEAIAVTASLDRSCKIYSLAQGCLLRSVSFPSSVHCVATDPFELALYAGGGEGHIYEVSLVGSSVPEVEQNGSSGAAQHSTNGLIILEGHSQAVTSLAFSTDGLHMVSGSEDRSARVWDVRTRQPVRVLADPAKGPISTVIVLERPPYLAPSQRGSGGASTSGGEASRKGPKRPQPLAPFAKHMGAVGVLQPWEGAPVLVDGSLVYRGRFRSIGRLGEPAPDEACSTGSMGGAGPVPTAGRPADAGGNSAEVQAELQQLRAELDQQKAATRQWQQLHSELHGYCVKHLLVDTVGGGAV